jgi:hypothetical protein
VLLLVPDGPRAGSRATRPRARLPAGEPRRPGAARTTIPFVRLSRAGRMPGPVPGLLLVAAQGERTRHRPGCSPSSGVALIWLATWLGAVRGVAGKGSVLFEVAVPYLLLHVG